MSAWSRLAPYVEPAMTLGTGMAAEVPAGLAGLAGMLFEGYDPARATAKIDEVRDRFTYLPRSKGGAENLGTVAGALETMGDYAERGAEAMTGSKTPFADVAAWVNKRYGPEAAAAVFTAPEALSSALGFRGGQMARAARRGAQAGAAALPAVAPDIPRLPHGQTVRGVHFSNAQGLEELDPNRYGTGAMGAERSRLRDQPDIAPRSHFYLDDRVKGERGTGPHRYQAELRDVYDLSADPEGIRAAMRQRFTTPADAPINPGMIDWEAVQNETERRIRELGYGGYMTPGGSMPAAVMFGRTPVSPYPVAR